MRQNLNFSWHFKQSFEEAWLSANPANAEIVDIPHAAKQIPFNYFNEKDLEGTFTYIKEFDCFEVREKTILTFDGVMLQFRAFLNGTDLGNHISGWFGVSIDVSEIVKEKGNRLVVVVDSHEDKSIPPFGNVVDYLTFGGIYREVHIDTYNLPYCSDVFIQAHADGSITTKATVVGDGKATYRLLDKERIVATWEGEASHIDNVHRWSIEDPYLYTLETIVGDNVTRSQIGFRDACFKQDGFYLNGVKTKLIGLNRHQNYPYVGPAMPKAAQQDDARILKNKLGINCVRTSHYADSEHFLNECDRLGLLVLDEVPGWQYIGCDESWMRNFYDFVRRLIAKERNHPSLIAYGLRIDESKDDHDLYTKAQEIKNELDPNRASIGVRNFKGSECLETVYGYNDFSCHSKAHGLDDPKSDKSSGHPVLVTEFMGHMFPTKSNDPRDRRVEHALRHARVLDDAYKYADLCGAIGWCAFDYNTHKEFGTGDHICFHGVMDMMREPKMASFVYASQFLPGVFEVSNNPSFADCDAAKLEPVYVFTDCDSVVLFRNGKKIKEFHPCKSEFPNLPHAPIKIDDFIGESFDEPSIKGGDKEKLKFVLNYAAMNGFQDLPLSIKATVVRLAIKYKLNFQKFSDLYFKYMAGWGGTAIDTKIEGYKGGEKVAEKILGPHLRFHYEIEVSKSSLVNEETFDVSRIVIRKKDDNGHTLPYSADVIEATTEGPIAIMGPSKRSLQGGVSSIYVRSILGKGKATLHLDIEGERHNIPFDVDC